ncbi:hypothetical protein [Amycolatopsis sp. WQ 127309]|uniref:hypothetical protein n=1 Tax=Amycolatopsis sp. WQ 127309 TaxID=2932773 RepID=UPI001FF191C2|nr:hypothetical protein [Amycolatopsis sp. WQ 127309]UOZ10539.1 hypothetical protein MUY22_20650 [Amycolatopsis sp. WQ 127309]
MSQLNPNKAFAQGILGNVVAKSTGTLAATTIPLFTIAGGLVSVTSIVGRVTTAITVANSYKLQHNPTAGSNSDLCTATDIGTTDTAVGEILVAKKGASLAIGAALLVAPVVMDTGQIESVSAGTDGVIKWYVTWVPVDDGATLVAA